VVILKLKFVVDMIKKVITVELHFGRKTNNGS